jgi:hypothetical protein
MTMTHLDLAGHEIKPGCIVAYAALWDRSATLKYGLVTRLATRMEGNPSCAVPTIRAVTVDREFLTHRWDLQKDGKEVALCWLDRMLVVPRDLVPAAVLAIFDAVRGK